MMRRSNRRAADGGDVTEVGEGTLFLVLTLTERARRLDDDELAREWNRANRNPDVTVWYHVLSCEQKIRQPDFMGGLRRGSRMMPVGALVRSFARP